MSVAYVQSNSFANGGSVNISLPYVLGPNIAGNMGLAVCFTDNGTAPSSISDTNGNTWCAVVRQNGNLGQIAVFICQSLKAGANTVKASFGCSPIGGTPALHIWELSYTGPAAYLVLQPCNVSNNLTVVLEYASFVGTVAQGYSATMFAMLIDTSGNSHSWSVGFPGAVKSYSLESSGNTSAVAFITTSGNRPALTFADPNPLTNYKPVQTLPLLSFLVVD